VAQNRPRPSGPTFCLTGSDRLASVQTLTLTGKPETAVNLVGEAGVVIAYDARRAAGTVGDLHRSNEGVRSQARADSAGSRLIVRCCRLLKEEAQAPACCGSLVLSETSAANTQYDRGQATHTRAAGRN
jgi:hypothetical protein